MGRPFSRPKVKTNACPGCRADLGPNPARFCTSCGQSLNPQDCPKCRHKVGSPSQNFCVYCGHPFNQAATRGRS